jgi:hypothetical protein
MWAVVEPALLESNFIWFKMMICIKKVIGSFFLTQNRIFLLLEPLQVPNPDKTPKVNVKTEALPQNFL